MGRDRRGVTKASESSIQITFQYRGQRCREKIPLKPTAANLKRAEQHRAAILHAISAGTFDYAATFPHSARAMEFADSPGQVILAGRFLSDWLASQQALLKASTWDGYRKIVNNLLIPQFGALVLEDLKRRVIRDWLKTLTCGNKRLGNVQSVLREALSSAMHDDLIESNPLYGWKYVRQQSVKEDDDIDPFTPEEQAAIIAACPPGLAEQIQFSLWTGLRPSELIALDWGNIDFVRRVVIIRKAITTASKGQVESTKTRAGQREIKLLAPAVEALARQKPRTFLAVGAVFVHPVSGKRWTGDQQIRDHFKRILVKAGVRYRRPYQTRHTYASMLLSAGEHPMWVAAQMGHSDWTMIARIYGRWMPAADPDAGSKVESIFADYSAPKSCPSGAKTA